MKELWWVVPNALHFFYTETVLRDSTQDKKKRCSAKESVGTREQHKKTESERVQICCYVPVQGVSNTS